MSWGASEYLQGLWLALVLVGLYFLAERGKRNRLKKFADSDVLPRMTSSLSRPRRNLKFVFFLLAVLLVIVGLAQPQDPGKMVMVKKEGIDIVITVDVSDSMLAQDIRPSRLEKAKLELQELVEITRGDRIGVVAFAGDAYVQVPLTTDRSAVKLFLKSLSPNLIPVPGTAIARAIQASVSLFDKGAKGDKVIVLLTDGEDHEADPLLAARDAKKAGVRIYTIGIGTAKGDVIPVRATDRSVRFKRDLFGKVVVSKLDEKVLVGIAEMTGGVYYRSQRGLLEVEKIYSAIQGLEQRETGSSWVVEYDPRYQIPVLLAVFLLMLHMMISERRNEEIS